MAKASLPEYRLARAAALRALGQIQTDGLAPDRIMFLNESHGFVIRFTVGELHLQRIISWSDWRSARHVIVREVVPRMLEELARAEAKE